MCDINNVTSEHSYSKTMKETYSPFNVNSEHSYCKLGLDSENETMFYQNDSMNVEVEENYCSTIIKNHSDNVTNEDDVTNPNQAATESENIDPVLKVGLSFNSREEIRLFVDAYSNKINCKMIVSAGGANQGCISRHVKWSCAYGKLRNQKQLQFRRYQHTKKKNCPVFIKASCRKDGTCHITGFEEHHNHINTLAMYQQETHKVIESSEIQCVKEAAMLNLKACQVKNMMVLKFGKKGISSQHIRYVMNKLKDPANDDEDLSLFLELVVSEGRNVNILQEKEKVRVITVETLEMKRAFKGAKPDVVLVDTTFNFSNSCYKMSAFCYLNPVTNRGEIAQLSFMADECEEAYRYTFAAFKESVNNNYPRTFMVDKDFNEINVLMKTFPGSNILFCNFHVLKWMKQVISTAIYNDSKVVDIEKKSDIMESFRKVLYSQTSEMSILKEEVFLSKIKGVSVKVGSSERVKYQLFEDYYYKNWSSCKEMWMMHRRKGIIGLEEETTNNRLERMWRSMKTFTSQKCSKAVSIQKVIIEMVGYAERRIEEKYTWDLRHNSRVYHEDPKLRDEFSNAGLELNDRGVNRFSCSIRNMTKQRNNMEVVVKKSNNNHFEVSEKFPNLDNKDLSTIGIPSDNKKIYVVSHSSCNCSWHARNGAPCKHVLFLRETFGLPLT